MNADDKAALRARIDRMMSTGGSLLSNGAAARRLIDAIDVDEPAPESPVVVTPPAAPSRPRLSWAPPELHDPLTVTVRRGERAEVKAARDRDVVIDAADGILDGELNLYGGRNVVGIGFTIDTGNGYRGLIAQGHTGDLFLQGVHVRGAGLKEGINLDERAGATVTLQDVLIDPIAGTLEGHHADLLQTWAGPTRLRIDRLDGWSDYQGLFLDPFKFPEDKTLPRVPVAGYDLRRVLVRGVGSSGFWQSGVFPVTTDGCVVVTASTKTPAQLLRRGAGNPVDPWAGVTVVKVADAAEVAAYPTTLTGIPGAGYVSPGYERTA